MCFPAPMAQTTPTNPAKYPVAEAAKMVRSQATPVSKDAPTKPGAIPKSQSAKPGSGASLSL